MDAQPETPPSSPETPQTWTVTPNYDPSPEWIVTPDHSPGPTPLPSPEPTPPPPSPVWAVSNPYTFQGVIDQALLDDIEEFASLGWLDGHILDGCMCGDESDSETLA